MEGWIEGFLEEQRVGRLATVDARYRPHVVPIVYAFDGERLYTPIDAKPKQVEPNRLQRVCNIRANPYVAVIVDHYSEEQLEYETGAMYRLRQAPRGHHQSDLAPHDKERLHILQSFLQHLRYAV